MKNGEESRVFKQILGNGLTVLVLPRREVPKVSLQLWYGVGSKDEQSGQRGIAHLIEHMIFKGTEKLSESDISAITYRLSGSCNAFTSHDYTGYLFDMPEQHWREILPVMADCMANCTFKRQHLNSELKAVIQELKMYNDDYFSTLIERMVGTIFADHPYHYPIVGYKQDLWGIERERLVDFYKKFYVPHNATLVVVGDVEPDAVFTASEQNFGSIAPGAVAARSQFYHGFDVASSQTTIYRDVQQPILLFAWAIPGVRAKREYHFDLISWILGSGRGARLYTKLVTELGLATEVQSFVYDLFDQSLFFIYVQPRTSADMPEIEQIIMAEIERYRRDGMTDAEFARAERKTGMDLISLYENNQRLAYLLGKCFVATGDEQYLANYDKEPREQVKVELHELFKTYFAPVLACSGRVLPLSPVDKPLWIKQQEISESEDAKILSGVTREAAVEPPAFAKQITPVVPKAFSFPRAERFTLPNGIEVFALNRPGFGKIDLLIDLKAKHFYDPVDKQGCLMMVADLLQEGTKRHSATALAIELESLGMELNTFPGQIGMTMLSKDLQTGFGLLNEVLNEPTFDDEAIERIRTQMLAELKLFWDTPADFIAQLARQQIYGAHPYGRNIMGTSETISGMKKLDILDCYERSITPSGARLAIVGDFGTFDVRALLESSLGQWRGVDVQDFNFPALTEPTAHLVKQVINRDQIVLGYAGLSVERLNQKFDALLLFDQILTGGVLGSMNSRLFEVREQTGLFYTIGGSLLAGAARQPGMVFIKAIVSPDRLAEAEHEIEKVFKTGASDLTQEELEEARRALINSFVDNFTQQRQTAATFIQLDTYGFGSDYFDLRPEQLMRVGIEEIQQAVSQVLDTEKLVKIRVGRV
ncbi:MAG: insulinase family protein [Candidatus Dependentiae bacterium]|nr:insulinase family protein [Candidatus Dependentiae bacterium]